MQIGQFLRIQWTDLYRPPPSREALEEIGAVDPLPLSLTAGATHGPVFLSALR
jgi:hypothetical protein